MKTEKKILPGSVLRAMLGCSTFLKLLSIEMTKVAFCGFSVNVVHIVAVGETKQLSSIQINLMGRLAIDLIKLYKN